MATPPSVGLRIPVNGDQLLALQCDGSRRIAGQSVYLELMLPPGMRVVYQRC